MIIKKEKEIKMGTLDRTINKMSSVQTTAEPQLNISTEEVKQRLQKVTQNATPLGKVLEFLEKDLKDMQEEYVKWENEEKTALKELGWIHC